MHLKTKNKKIKVAWICHFANEKITQLLKDVGVIRGNYIINEFATWINVLIPLFECGANFVELHIIAPYTGLKNDTSIIYKDVYYHFVNTGILKTGYKWSRRFFPWDYYSNFYSSKRKVKRLIESLNPDIIHLFGAENAHYSSWIYNFISKYPILLTVQGFHFLTNSKKSYINKKRTIVEKDLYEKINHINIRTTFMADIVRKINGKAKLYDFFLLFPLVDPKNLEIKIKRYDFIYYGRIVKTKGIEDTLNAFSKILIKNPNLLLGIVGGGGKEYIEYLKNLSKKLGINENIEFLGYFSSLKKAHEIVSTGKILILPTYNDIIPGTIIEAMLMKIPVIAYKSGGIPDLNKNEEVIKLAEPGNIDQLAEYMDLLINNNELSCNLALKGYNEIQRIVNNENVFHNFLKCYKDVILDFVQD